MIDAPTQVTPPVSDPIELELETSTEKNSNPTKTDTVNDSTAMETATMNDSTSLEPVSVAKETQQSTPQQTHRPSRPSRKLNPKSTLLQRPSSIGTLDRFVSRTKSPSTKRKLSEESLSPASVQNLKSTRTDGADEVSYQPLLLVSGCILTVDFWTRSAIDETEHCFVVILKGIFVTLLQNLACFQSTVCVKYTCLFISIVRRKTCLTIIFHAYYNTSLQYYCNYYILIIFYMYVYGSLIEITLSVVKQLMTYNTSCTCILFNTSQTNQCCVILFTPITAAVYYIFIISVL